MDETAKGVADDEVDGETVAEDEGNGEGDAFDNGVANATMDWAESA